MYLSTKFGLLTVFPLSTRQRYIYTTISHCTKRLQELRNDEARRFSSLFKNIHLTRFITGVNYSLCRLAQTKFNVMKSQRERNRKATAGHLIRVYSISDGNETTTNHAVFLVMRKTIIYIYILAELFINIYEINHEKKKKNLLEKM